MKSLSWLTDTLFLKLVALLLSLLLWGGVAAGRHGAEKVAVPLKILNLSPGLAVRGTVPAQIEIEVVGPRILLFQLRHEQLAIALDFSGITGGIVAFDHLGQSVDLNPGLEVIRTSPGRLQVWVEPTGGSQVQY
jgi:YbbR-like protein